MRNVLRVGAVIGALALCAASATPYQQSGIRGGYETRQLGGNRWLIHVEVNSFTSQSTATEYAYRRAAEICPNGFDPVDRSSSTEYTAQGDAKPGSVLVVQCK
jgi:hypothetical protein